MAEIVFKYPEDTVPRAALTGIRWLSANDYAVFNEHLLLCGQRIVTKEIWQDILEEGTIYCILFADQKPVARACVEKYSNEYWEVADVRVAKEFRNRGYAKSVCAFVLRYILDNGKQATIRTEDSNSAMLCVIKKMGFVLKN